MAAPIPVFDFEVNQSIMKQFAAAGTTDSDDLRQLARTIALDYCPDGIYSDEMIDVLVSEALAAANGSPDAVE